MKFVRFVMFSSERELLLHKKQKTKNKTKQNKKTKKQKQKQIKTVNNFTVKVCTSASTTNKSKNGSYSTIYTFKNYFATVFFSFQFSAVSKWTLNLVHSYFILKSY